MSSLENAISHFISKPIATNWEYASGWGADGSIPIPEAPYLSASGTAQVLFLKRTDGNSNYVASLTLVGLGIGAGWSVKNTSAPPALRRIVENYSVTFSPSSNPNGTGSKVYTNPIFSNPNLTLDDLRGPCVLLSFSGGAVGSASGSMLFMGCNQYAGYIGPGPKILSSKGFMGYCGTAMGLVMGVSLTLYYGYIQ